MISLSVTDIALEAAARKYSSAVSGPDDLRGSGRRIIRSVSDGVLRKLLQCGG